jgi:hypothetical protein
MMFFFKPEAITWREAQSLSKKPREWKDDVSIIRKRQAARSHFIRPSDQEAEVFKHSYR